MASPQHKETVSRSDPVLCSKCKRMVVRDGSSLHSILAYSRCRCHRLFRYHSKPWRSNTDLRVDTVVSTVRTKEPDFSSTARATPQNSMIFVSCSKSKKRLLTSQLVQVVQDLESQSRPKLVAVSSTKECSVPLPAINSSLIVANQTETISQNSIKKPESSYGPLSATSVAKLPTITSEVVENTKQSQNTSTSAKMFPQHICPISEVLDCVSMNKKRDLYKRFKQLDKNDDGHLTFTEFLSAVHKHVSKCSGALDKLKQLYTMLSEPTYFGYREFTLCYSITEKLNSIQTVEGWSMERLLSLVKKTQ